MQETKNKFDKKNTDMDFENIYKFLKFCPKCDTILIKIDKELYKCTNLYCQTYLKTK